jgi:Sulfotransferase family
LKAPVLVGAVGGSGTRVVARILSCAGFFIGAERNEAEDSEPVMRFYNAWLRPYLECGGVLPPAAARAVAVDFRRAIDEHRRGIRGLTAPWAVKVPRSLLMLPYWQAAFPEARFIHMIRSGLDMAYSSDANQVRMFADLMLPQDERDLGRPQRAIAYWRTANLRAAQIGSSRFGSHYFLLRFEDLCAKPHETISALATFLGASVDVGRAAHEIVPPSSIGRWREHDVTEIRSLLDLAHPALQQFGYWDAELTAIKSKGQD